MRPGFCEVQGLPLVSWIGSASMSARKPMTGPSPRAALDEGDDAGAADAGLDPVAAEFLQLVSDEARGLETSNNSSGV